MVSGENGYHEILDYEDEITEMDINDNAVVTKQEMDILHAYTGHARAHSANWKDFLLKPELNQSLEKAGFEHPSDVQAQCIPPAALGQDIICQAKSGMGKTAVFVISTLQALDVGDPKQPTIICLSPTRELAYQIAVQFRRFKELLPGKPLMGLFYGGRPIHEDKANLAQHPIHIVIGTPGRLVALIKEKALDLSNIKHFIVDECDKMLQQLDMREQVQEIFKATPNNKQVLMFTATMPLDVLPICRGFTQNALEVIVEDPTKLSLESVVQHYMKVSEDKKIASLADLLDLLDFNQVIIFVNKVERAGWLGELLADQNFPVIMIHSAMTQDERLARYQQFKSFHKRILVATDLFGRGMDIEHVNVVINFDCPRNSDVYLHRIARAGRFGARGLAVTFVSNNDESKVMNEVQDRFDINIDVMPDEIDPDLYRGGN